MLVNLGGDLSIAGAAPRGGWLVQVTEDHAAAALKRGQTVRVSDGGLATSSTTVRRWATAEGLAPPHRGSRRGDSAAEVWRTVSVAAGSCVDANVASTAAIVHGEAAPGWLAALGPSEPPGGSGRARSSALADGRRRLPREPASWRAPRAPTGTGRGGPASSRFCC